MFTDTPPTVKARFESLKFRETPHHFTRRQREKAEALARTVQAIRPGVYRVGACWFDLWENGCSCRAHRIEKQRPCLHRVALWLSEGIQIDDQNPAAYLKEAGIEPPDVIAIYAHVGNCAGLYRIEATTSATADGRRWFECFPLNGGESTYATCEDLHRVAPFYE